MKLASKLTAVLLVFCMLASLVACGVAPAVEEIKESLTEREGKNTFIPDQVVGKTEIPSSDFVPTNQEQTAPVVGPVTGVATGNGANSTAPKGVYNKGTVLIKVKEGFSATSLGELSYTSAEALYKGSKWYAVSLTDVEATEEAVEYLSGLNTFEKVDYDYIMGVTGPKEEAKENPNYDNQVNLGLSNIPNGWTQNGKAPGGSPDVVVAVIDTGVDYNHLDLRNNIWVNIGEIPNNGKDDDGNGYVDDVYGWDCVGNDNDPMDDNGHGTHVAGIIAAENNKEGGIGVAYNCKVMVLKAGNSSGYFNNSDIAEAIQYAYMNGADVINMSFGGSNISIAVEDALENAYASCVLVAAAGNDGACNNLGCQECEVVGVCYPAALPYVIGVMSTDKDGKHISSFSNYDHNPYDSIEYEVYAVGEGVGSTWPSNKYACLNGTSMAAPTVSGIAALLRSYYTDREVYSTKFIQSQIVNTGTVNPHIFDHETDEAHSVADVVEALTKLPKPAVNLYDYKMDDSVSISSKNNGNGVIDAGETVRLYVSLHNRGGVASNVNVSIDTYRREIGNEALTDPYFTFVNPTMQISDIGTYSVRESGDKYFEIIVSADCPNDYLVNFNIRFTYENGLDENDDTLYKDDCKQKARFNVSRGFLLPATITEDTTYTADRLYIVGQDVVIAEGVTVTFKEGCEIQFYDDREYYNSPIIKVYGTLNIAGTQEKMITIAPNKRHSTYGCKIEAKVGSNVIIQYAKTENLLVYETPDDNKAPQASEQIQTVIRHSSLKLQETVCGYVNGRKDENGWYLLVDQLANSYANVPIWSSYIKIKEITDSYVVSNAKNGTIISDICLFANCILITQNGPRTSSYIEFGKDATMTNNLIIAPSNSLSELIRIRFMGSFTAGNNEFSFAYQQYASQIINGYYGSTGTPIIDVFGSLSEPSALWPYVVGVEMFDVSGNPITTIGREEIKVRVTFNRPMDTSKNTYLTFGTFEPYADYRINGEWVSDTVWEGTYTLKAQIENGQNFLKVNNACAADDPTKTVFGENHLYEFTIDTTAAMSMNLQASPKAEGIELTFAQDDYDTLLGYNIYRATSKDGNFVKINPTILLPEENTFLDENAEPGKTYWYTYTVVLSDFSESNPAGMVVAMAMDTMSPLLYHTPVNQGYENNNLVISATASDNVGISTVTLYYRTVGETSWKSLAMVKQNDKYSAKIFGSDVTLAGLEYYIVATDGINQVQKGSAETPYTVVVKEAESLLGKGDVDGNGVITTKDALMLMQRLNGDLILSPDAFKRADLNDDGFLSTAEALLILQYVNGKITSLKM